MLELLEYLVLGIGVGTVGALLGLGGGFILVPIFMLFMIAPHGSTFTTVQQVVGTSLFAVFCNAISGTFAYIRQRRILMRAAVPFALATLPGAFLGGYLSEWFSGPGFSLAFGILMVFIGYIMYSKSRGKAANKSVEDWDPATARFNMPLGILCSFFVGFLSSIFGIGGGIVHVPMMVFVLGFPPQIAVATSTFVLFVSAVMGVSSHALLGHIIWGPALMIGAGAVIGAQLGAKIAKKSKTATACGFAFDFGLFDRSAVHLERIRRTRLVVTMHKERVAPTVGSFLFGRLSLTYSKTSWAKAKRPIRSAAGRKSR